MVEIINTTTYGQMNKDLNPCSPEELVIRTSFKADYKLSCPVLDDNDIFQKSLEIWDLEGDWELYKTVLQKYSNFEQFRKDLRAKIVSTIQNVPKYSALYAPKIKNPWTGPRSYLVPENAGKRLLSVDLVQANYQALRFLGTQYVLNTKNYDEFIRLFTDEPALIKSKIFRQNIFGLLNPDLQREVQAFMINNLITIIKGYPTNINNNHTNNNNNNHNNNHNTNNNQNTKERFPIVHLTSDEVVFLIESDNDIQNILTKLKKQPITYQFRLKEFSFYSIPNGYSEPWYVRMDKPVIYESATKDIVMENPISKNPIQKVQKKPRIMGCHIRYLFQLHNKLMNIPNGRKDFWWRECGRLCQVLEPEQIEVPKEYTEWLQEYTTQQENQDEKSQIIKSMT